MPQLDISTFPTQLVWLLITFVALYVLLAKIALPRIGEVLDERQRKIDDMLEKAAALKAEADAAVAAYEKALTEAKSSAQEMLRQTQAEFAAKAEARSHELGARLASDIKAGEARIAAAKESALGGIKDVARDVATSVIERLAGAAPDAGKLAQAVERAAGERR